MEFESTFEVQAPIDEVYAALLDVERVTPCVPGAEVIEQTGEDAYKLAIKVKVGPIKMQYKGDVEVIDRNADEHRATLRAKARESRGQGTANATVEMRLTADGATTRGTIHSDVKLSGRAASMGQGAVKDVSAALIEDFSKNLAAMLGSGSQDEAAATAKTSAAKPAKKQSTPARANARKPPGKASASAQASTAKPAADRKAASASGEAGSEPTPLPPRPASPPRAEASGSSLSATRVAAAVIQGRLRDPRVLTGTLAIVFVVGYKIGRRR